MCYITFRRLELFVLLCHVTFKHVILQLWCLIIESDPEFCKEKAGEVQYMGAIFRPQVGPRQNSWVSANGILGLLFKILLFFLLIVKLHSKNVRWTKQVDRIFLISYSQQLVLMGIALGREKIVMKRCGKKIFESVIKIVVEEISVCQDQTYIAFQFLSQIEIHGIFPIMI